MPAIMNRTHRQRPSTAFAPLATDSSSSHAQTGWRPAPVSPAWRLSVLLCVAAVAGCATDGSYESRASPRARAALPADSSASSPAPLREASPITPTPPTLGSPAPLPQPAPVPYPSANEARLALDRLLPTGISERSAWAVDILTAFASLRIPALAENLCATIAIIAQESSFQADPPVPGLAHIVWQEIERRRERYAIPKVVLDLALLKSSPDGRTYRARIDALRTEKQMNALYEEMISELPAGRMLLGGYNPVRTGGPMQVSVTFAEEQVRNRPYPYTRRDSIRDQVFTRRGGVYFGVAMLLDYPAAYSQMLYRFADFNAGRYSSRNAAFQSSVARLSGSPLALDGDLLRYSDGSPAAEASDTQRAIQSLRVRLNLSEAEILRDLKLEKSFAFEQTPLYQRLYALADAAGAGKRPRELLPRIDLKSPKISRRLTTEWFARRVDERYRNCLERNVPAT
ncbi:protein of unknown function DUF1615 [Candidatus Accumulibacter phosphatis]|uniref:DUF1615 domain-containing protein n=1 Tax=Accumulibacter regalis TaxID=522306 RepID=C7RJM5_ACCRE